MKLIHGPEDVAVGDLVRFEVGIADRRGHREARVVAVRDTEIDVDGPRKARTLKMWKDSKSFLYPRREHLLHVVEPIDLWMREKPAGFDLRPSGIMNRSDLAEIDVDSLLSMTPEEASAKLLAFIEWLQRRPS